MVTETRKTKAESKAQFWKRHIENYNSSSLTQAQYCKEQSLALATFCYWKKRLKMTRQIKPRFYPLTVQSVQQEKSTSSSAGLSLSLGNDKFRIDIFEDFSAIALKKLITTLEEYDLQTI